MKRAATALLVGLMLVAAVASVVVARERSRRPTAALARAVGPHRVTVARLTGGFSYAVCAKKDTSRGLVDGLICGETTPAQWSEAEALERAATEMRGERGSADVRRFSADWHVLWSEADTAVGELRELAAEAPASAEIRSDLAAALLERAEAKQDPLSIVEAYVAADSATLLSPDLAEARFNRALALEWLYLHEDAIAAWSAYLERDGTSPWAEEARSHLRRLRTRPPGWESDEPRLRAALVTGDSGVVWQVVRRFPWRARVVMQTSVRQWAHAYQAGDLRADSLLARCELLAAALAGASGDSLWLDVARDIRRKRASQAARLLAVTARGMIAEETARRYLEPDRLQLDSANTSVREALRSLRSAQNAVTYLAMYDSALVPYQRHTPEGYDAALAAFRRVRRDARPSYKYSRGMAARSQALIHASRADFEVAAAGYVDAIHDGEGSGEPGLEVRPRTTLASLVFRMRGAREAWKPLYGAFRASARFGDDPSEGQLLATFATTLTEKATPRVAVAFQRQAVRLAKQLGNASTTVKALATEAELLARVGATVEARASARQAREYSVKIVGDSIRGIYTADIDLVDGVIWLGSRPDSAAAAFRGALNRYRRTQNRIEIARAEVLLARAHMAAGAIDSAQHAFDDGLSEIERRRAELSDTVRGDFLDQVRPVIDTMLLFHLRRGDTVGALEFLETMRARVLLERMRGEPSRLRMIGRGADGGGRVAQLQTVIPPKTTVISYALLDRTLIAWLVRRDGVTMYRSVLDAPIEPLIDRFHALINGPPDERQLRATSTRLHDLLIGPFRNRLAEGTRLVFIPDKRLQFVPFAALFDSRAKRFLVESFEIGIAPSLELYAASLARFDALGSHPPTRVLAVGNPAFDARVFALPSLPGAEREAEQVARAYPHARLLVGPAATARRFLEAAQGADVIHFAGHGVVRPDAPLSSHLVLAPDSLANSTGEIYAGVLYNATFAHTRLAILSGCHTAGGELSDTEGVSSLARALFAAGVPAVIASLWAVDDAQTAEFFVAFHQQVVRGADPTTLLREAELRWLGRDADPWRRIATWASFEVFGATSLSGRSE
jgi:CHAT domain-containing protein